MKRRQTDASVELRKGWRPEDRKGSPVQRKKVALWDEKGRREGGKGSQGRGPRVGGPDGGQGGRKETPRQRERSQLGDQAAPESCVGFFFFFLATDLIS